MWQKTGFHNYIKIKHDDAKKYTNPSKTFKIQSNKEALGELDPSSSPYFTVNYISFPFLCIELLNNIMFGGAYILPSG
jgi:hypothetical protein